MISFTLDTNCLIALDIERDEAPWIRKLVRAHQSGQVDVALVAISASERQQGDKFIQDYSEFDNRVRRLGLGDLTELLPILHINMGFINRACIASKATLAREEEIHKTLHPNIEYKFSEFRKRVGGPKDLEAPESKKWRNAACDTRMFWAHDNAKRDHFVTSDANFRKKLIGHNRFPNASVLTPKQAAAML